MSGTWEEKQKRIFEIVEIGEGDDHPSRAYDWVSALLIIVYVVVSILETFDHIRSAFGGLLSAVEVILVLFFTLDYILRLITARCRFPAEPRGKAVLRYVLSAAGLVDLFSFLPYYLPFFFPAGLIAFRMVRVVRIFRLFRINRYYDSLNVIAEVLSKKKQQLLSSVFIVLVLMIASSLCMYSVEHEAQPEVFNNAFSGIWWTVSTLLTVGYGDIYPITFLGRFLGIIITFLGVGMVAIPTGIISAGFVEQYTEVKKRSEFLHEADVLFVKVRLTPGDPWIGKRVRDLLLPHGLIAAAVLREGHAQIPRGDIALKQGDVLVLGAEPTSDGEEIDLKEMVLGEQSPWVGQQVRDIDIPRRSLVVMIKRQGEVIIPRGHHEFRAGDWVYLYTESRIRHAEEIRL